MKAKYIKPDMNIVIIQQQSCLLGTSTIDQGDEYGGTKVLSRKSSLWDDEEDE